MILGHATSNGTLRFSQNTNADQKNFKNVDGLSLSNVGMGTYLGNTDTQTDELVKNAIKQSVHMGINIIDTAINYRAQKAERAVGSAISELVNENKISREQIFISTKNGYVTNDADIPDDFWKYVNSEYIQKGIIKTGDISSGYHCMSIPYLEDQLDKSLKNLDLDCIDLLYLHNAVEGQKDISKEKFLEKLKNVFELYERKRKEGLIQYYGMATWECFRVLQDNSQFLSLEHVLDMAKDIGGNEHGFKFIQLPFNLYYDQAYMIKNQPLDGQQVSILEAARNFGIGVFTSVPFMQGKLLQSGAMPDFFNLSPPLRALQFIRSMPGVLAPLVGQKSVEHVNENLEIMKIAPVSENELSQLAKKLIS